MISVVSIVHVLLVWGLMRADEASSTCRSSCAIECVLERYFTDGPNRKCAWKV